MNFEKLALAIRFLSMDAVEKAQSGHPGMPLGMADIATVLWQKFLKHSPTNPRWFNRDRFVLSNGHGSMLLYSLLHLTGYKLSIEDLQQFRQLHSKTPGHPECTDTPGVETTTGPLGQGIANGVGMALAEKILASQFNTPELTLIDHYTYVFAGDGCLMEGVSHEACSLAGTLGLSKLIIFYDDNGISIDGQVKQWFTDDTAMRFAAYNWHVEKVDGHHMPSLEKAILNAQRQNTRPSLIICKTVIGFGSAAAGRETCHGAPLGEEDIQSMRNRFNWPYPPFTIPSEIYAAWSHIEEGNRQEQDWLQVCHEYKQQHPDRYAEFLRRINGDLPDIWYEASQRFINDCLGHHKTLATRKASQFTLEAFAPLLPELFGGSADLTGSNNTNWSGSKAITQSDSDGNYLYYGVREFGMSAMMNGLALHGGFIPYGGTFLVFSDYARNAVRLSALMRQRVIYIFTHDSIGLGEDGPTHQPVEHASMLRMTPNLQVWRPADLVETATAWQQALEHQHGPSALLLSRQDLPTLQHNPESLEDIAKGGYILLDSPNGVPDIILIATGSEVQIAVAVAQILKEDKVAVRVVSMPCAERFLQEDRIYQDMVLPNTVRKRVAIEAASTAYWYQFVGLDGLVIGLDRFGVSAPGADAYQDRGITVEHTIQALRDLYT